MEIYIKYKIYYSKLKNITAKKTARKQVRQVKAMHRRRKSLWDRVLKECFFINLPQEPCPLQPLGQ